MLYNKKHHYVPRFYLRNFSPDSRSVAVYNLKSDVSINAAPIKGQCYKNYLYGDDGQTEQALCDVESTASRIIGKIISTRELPPKFSVEHVTLMFYVVIQNARTLNAGAEHNEMLDAFAKHLFRRHRRGDIKPEDLDRVKVQWDNAVRQSISNAVEVYPLVLDLEMLLLSVATNECFITSDNPVVLYNQFLEDRNYASNTGLQSVGLQIFLPLSPNFLILFFDRAIYGVGCRNQRTIRITNLFDIRAINELQLLNAVENVYYHPGMTGIKVLSDAFKKIRGKRRTHKANLHSQVEKLSETKERELLGLYREDIKNDLQLSFLKIERNAQRIKEEVVLRVAVRDQHLCDELRLFRDLVKKGIFNRGDFTRYLAGRAHLPPPAE